MVGDILSYREQYTSTYHPKSNGRAERENRNLKRKVAFLLHFFSEACLNLFLEQSLENHISLTSFFRDKGKQYSPRCDATERSVLSGVILFA